MTIDAPAKVNLGLHVLRKRPDGYHDIETVMVRLGWFDTIEAFPGDDLSLTCSDPALPVGSENLCIKAAVALASRFKVKRGVRLHLTKRIPFGAGLGGGSSDAAATLLLLARLWKIDVSTQELAEIGAGLGADVPFFFGPSPALAKGIGGDLTALNPTGAPLDIPFHFVVVKPGPSVSTADAYRWVMPSEAERADLSELVRSCSLSRWRAELWNDFEGPIAERLPEIDVAKKLLYDKGAGFAGMSGSGSAVFGAFENEQTAKEARRVAAEEGYVCWMGEAV